MTLEKFKEKIQNKQSIDELIILVEPDRFLFHQYTSEIKTYYNEYELVTIDDLNVFMSMPMTPFISQDILYLYTCESLDIQNINLIKKKIIISCEKLSKEAESLYKEYIIKVPKLDMWQIKDYVYSRGKGVAEANLDKLQHITNNNMFRLEKELDKIEIFDERQRNTIFSEFEKNNVFSDLTDKTIWDLSNAIMKRDLNGIKNVLLILNNIDVEPMGLYVVLYNNFKNLLKVQLTINSSPETCGIKSNQYWAIKKNCVGVFTNTELINIFMYLVDIDRLIKTGQLTTDVLIDHMINHIV